ncbi:MAG: OsmC family protein [Thermoanaerobaculia bacterium]
MTDTLTPPEKKIKSVELERVSGFQFRVTFDPAMPQLLVDEAPPLGNGDGPEASRLLAAAIGNCLSSSLLFCLQKSRVEIGEVKTTVDATIERNEKGRLRVTSVDATIHVEIAPADEERAARCFGLFEDYCTVTGSVREAIPVTVHVLSSASGRILHES